MYLQLVREFFNGGATEGRLWLNGTFECYTLEDEDRKLEWGGTKIYGDTAIPRGEYEIVVTWSNRFQKKLPLLLEVEGFTGIRIHPGNTSEDTEGCILVGEHNARGDDDFIGRSRVAFDALMAEIEDALDSNELVTIEIV